ncbi:MAG: bifunctional 4-hydroxy-2-oxoglutarate aldolase/2-dehydro-3-deoxy-phosphogluconate aldolase [Planctomycetes bacterium]|nr:bifunctional 4-hydroxy-2-oxoglutarate aldolase/2-dehydro-3-deoxy-phosphogluconate aldolase [Planctomycetota bacterium]
MARYKRIDTLLSMKKVGVIPVFYNADFETAKNVICACADGGANVIEFTNRGDRAIEVFTALEKYCVENRPDIIMGVGSVIDAPTAAMYIAAGANFIVGPVLDKETAIACNLKKIPYSPGCGSATEIHEAHKLGVEICKVFPGSCVGGPEFVKSVKGPMPWTDIMPTGGVSPTEESLREWFGAGIVCAGIGSKLISKEMLQKNDYAGITEAVKKAVDLIKNIRNGG